MAGARNVAIASALIAIAGTIGAVAPAPASAATADVSIVKTDSVDPATAGTEFTYALTIANVGPDGATAVTTEDKLPSQTDFVAAVSSQGNCAEKGRTVTCELGTLASGAGATVAIRLVPRREGQLSNTATVTTSDTDPQEANNSDPETTTVIDAPAAPICAGRDATIVGTEGADTLTGTDGRDVIASLGGNDVIRGLDGKDAICGGADADVIAGEGDGDLIRAGSGDDRLRGGDGNDELRGGGGGDRLAGGRGSDSMNGGGGSDICRGGGSDSKRSC